MSETYTTEFIKHRIARTLEIQETLKKLPYPSNVYDSCRDYVGFIRGYCEFKKRWSGNGICSSRMYWISDEKARQNSRYVFGRIGKALLSRE